jgi:hypothetical protein
VETPKTSRYYFSCLKITQIDGCVGSVRVRSVSRTARGKLRLVTPAPVITLRETLAHEQHQTRLDEGGDLGDL